jgi:hypothetical protein
MPHRETSPCWELALPVLVNAALTARASLRSMWPATAIEFLRDLEANNDRDWFKANRVRYDSQLVEPARELAAQLADLGEPHLFRPYNDTRFHMRPPMKEQLGLAIGYGGAGGYYVEHPLTGCSWPPACTLRRPTSSTAIAPPSPMAAGPGRSSGLSGWRGPRASNWRLPS